MKPNNSSLAYGKVYGVCDMEREVNSSEATTRFLLFTPPIVIP